MIFIDGLAYMWDPVIEKLKRNSASWKRRDLSEDGNTSTLIKKTLLGPLVFCQLGARVQIMSVSSLEFLKCITDNWL